MFVGFVYFRKERDKHILGFCICFVFFMVFVLRKHKKGKPAERKHVFGVFGFFLFFVFLVFQDVGNDLYMQEMDKNACFWVLMDFMIFIVFHNARKHENKQNP